MATLGFVELILYMISKYYDDLDKKKYFVFADIHFALFYTAILNAFQSVILAVVSHRVARRIWVQTEMLELSHYVEIREEFEQVKAAMQEMGATTHSGPSSGGSDRPGSAHPESERRSFFRSFIDRFRYPPLRRKYNELLLQVRFHELRVHFLQAYNLPLMLKVSDYLLLSQQQVLLRLVHVSSIAWTLLTGAVNVMYYVLGIVSYKVADSTIVGTALIWIFFWSMGVFVLVAAAVRRKMKSIFKEIMIEKTLWGVQKHQEDRDKLREQQLELFWGSDPKLVIAAIQFMQFGYAVTFSVIVIFWQEIEDGDIPMVSYLVVIAVCYSVFVHVTARVIPQYTMCTSLGQLVDEKRLHETLAAFLLEESRRQDTERKLMKHFPQSLIAPIKNSQEDISNKVNHQEKVSREDLTGTQPTSLSPRNDSGSLSNHSVGNAVLMAELVKLDTDSLRMNLPTEERNKITFRQMERANRRGRQKSHSEGVATMAAMGNIPFPNLSSKLNQAKDDSFLSKSKEMTRPSYSFEASEKLTPEDTLQDSLARRRRSHRRLKTVSDGVAAMRGLQADSSVNVLSAVHEHVNEFRANSPKLAPEKSTVLDANEASKAFIDGSIEQVPNNADPDQLSVQSDGGHSDIDDVPDVEPRSRLLSLPIPAATIKMRFKKYVLSKKYIVLSNVFGTLVAFFLVGQRVESFLHSEGIVSDKFVSFDFNNEHTFWALFGLFSFFCVVDCAIMVALNPFSQQYQSSGEKKAFIATLLDFLLVSACLILFIIGEVKRCCRESESNGLASELVPNHANESRLLAAQNNNSSEIADYYNDPAPCSCPPFGHRLHGGLGTIEPFTAFVALRIFRHWAAGRIMNHFLSLQQGKPKDDGVVQGISSDPFAVFDESTRNGKSFGKSHDAHQTEIRGTAAELWKAAIGENPEVARKYGEFSCEVLKIMLGMSISSDNDKNVHVAGDSKDPRGFISTDDKSASFALGAEYAGLAPEAQEVILAGKIGRTVKHAAIGFGSTHGPIPEDEEAVQPNNFLFKLDRDASSRKLSSDIVFRSPHAQLVRSMRRCDRKLLPILNKWTVVDVVLTRFEIVYFDASNSDEAGMRSEAVKEALTATKGGKGLRLCDVAEGRRMVGRLEISDIECVTVQRYISDVESPEGDNDGPETEVQKAEFWKEAPLSHGVRFPRSLRWSQNQQDQLHIKTNHGRTLCLRFYSDLEDAKRIPHPINRESDSAAIQKNNAFQWVQTIGRFCGPDQLKQHLPHFGDGTDDELRDYLVEHRNSHEDAEKFGHRRVSSTGDLRGLLGRKTAQSDSSVHPLKNTFRMSFSRLPSLGEESDRAKSKEGAMLATTKPEKITRVQSVDGYFINAPTVEGEAGDVENVLGADPTTQTEGIMTTHDPTWPHSPDLVDDGTELNQSTPYI